MPLLADGGVLDVAGVVWATGYAPGFDWIELPVLGPNGLPRHRRGLVEEAPGLYFVGLHFQYALSSATLLGIDRDARYVVRALSARARAARQEAPPAAARGAPEGAAA
jgi:putative flavoprotein involved in K+ transport